ncbi:hypothetical protein HYX05_01230 [Candidatus Woesearchaeota archaeon]|nr:hypothetical protein [Candidatus Woesearchaeota archaeon]
MEPFPRYQNKEIKATKTAANELWRFKTDIWDILDILEKGYPCGRSKRKQNIIENCIKKGGKIHKAVVADCGDYWLVIHFGVFSYKKR